MGTYAGYMGGTCLLYTSGKARADADLGLAVVMHPHLVAGSQLGKVPGRGIAQGLSLIHISLGRPANGLVGAGSLLPGISGSGAGLPGNAPPLPVRGIQCPDRCV